MEMQYGEVDLKQSALVECRRRNVRLDALRAKSKPLHNGRDTGGLFAPGVVERD